MENGCFPLATGPHRDADCTVRLARPPVVAPYRPVSAMTEQTSPAPDLRYPVGPFTFVAGASPGMRDEWREEIRQLPGALARAVAGLDDGRLDTPYRPDGWTVRQLVHHVADSHLNAYVRLRLALTETGPTIRPYDERRWAELPDARALPPGPSLRLLEALHERWSALLDRLEPADWSRTLVHPERPGEPLTVEWLVAHYAWHSRHHLAHVTSLRSREGW